MFLFDFVAPTGTLPVQNSDLLNVQHVVGTESLQVGEHIVMPDGPPFPHK
jgi:hypothetical protein